MNKEEITYKIPNNQIHISERKDEDCLIWISPKALNMANTIDELQQENQELKKQLKDKTEDYKRMKDNFDSKVDVLTEIDTQQKEFIKWLEAMNRMYQNEYKDIDTAEHYNCVLQKYKSIIGDDK